ncbi:MAG: divergent polysaccharide deacetylase family protein [Alphaproteobacteria bacterium]|nr:divergent polysaccharide deacetylase family protein [Alphaproteobacteria bacterium]
MSPLAAVSLVLVILASTTAVWLQMSGPPERRHGAPAVVVKLSPPPQPAPPAQAKAPETTPAPAPAKAPETAPAPPAPPAPAPAKAPAPPAPAPAKAPAQAKAPAPAKAPETTPAKPAPPPTAERAPRRAAKPRTPTPKPASTATALLSATVGGGLRPAPDPALVEQTRLGPLPRVSADGRKAWQAYARPFDTGDRRPRLAIIVSGLGLSGAATEAAIQRLPGAVTLAFAPYAKGLAQWIALARAAGHEVLLDLPMEPVNFPANDPGPHTLLTSLTAEQNKVRLHWLLGRVTGYVGVVNRMGARFTTSETHVRPVLKELGQRGLLFVDSRSSLHSVAARMAAEVGLPRAINNRFIDAEASRAAIDTRLEEIERIAKTVGHAVGIGSPFPVTIDRLQRWALTLEGKGLVLAPVSALVNTQGN